MLKAGEGTEILQRASLPRFSSPACFGIPGLPTELSCLELSREGPLCSVWPSTWEGRRSESWKTGKKSGFRGPAFVGFFFVS